MLWATTIGSGTGESPQSPVGESKSSTSEDSGAGMLEAGAGVEAVEGAGVLDLEEGGPCFERRLALGDPFDFASEGCLGCCLGCDDDEADADADGDGEEESPGANLLIGWVIAPSVAAAVAGVVVSSFGLSSTLVPPT